MLGKARRWLRLFDNSSIQERRRFLPMPEGRGFRGECPMTRKTQQIATTSDGDDKITSTHPAFGQIVAHRTNGVQRSLYGSDFLHHNTMNVTISGSEMIRNLSNDWHCAGHRIVEIEMSEAQWARFVSAPNIGGGTPCTLRFADREILPDLPDPESRVDQFKIEADVRMSRAMAALDQLSGLISACGIPAGKAKALHGHVSTARRELSANLPFVAESFSEHIENTVEAARVEIHGYMTATIQRAGIESLGAAPIVLIGGKPPHA